MTELQVSRWFDNPEAPESHEDKIPICKWCKEVEGECICIDDWKIID